MLIIFSRQYTKQNQRIEEDCCLI